MSRDPDLLELGKPSKPVAGVVCILLGAAALLGPSMGDFFSDFPLWIMVMTGLPLLLGGTWIAFGRSVIALDRRRHTATVWWGVLIPFKTTTTSLVKYRTVLISKEMRSSTRPRRAGPHSPAESRSGPQAVYPVKLICEEEPPEADIVPLITERVAALDRVRRLREVGVRMHELESSRRERGMASIAIDAPTNLIAAREKAEKVATFLGLGVHDLNSSEG